MEEGKGLTKLKNPQEITRVTNPKLTVKKWKRFPEKISFERPNRYVIAGMPETGKSALAEVLAVKHGVHEKAKIIDIFCSRDNEGLAWCRHHKFKNNVLFVHGDSVRVSSEWDSKKISELKLKDFKAHQTIISVPAFYATLREEWHAIDRITRLLWLRTHWRDVWMLLVREGTSLLYSRLSLGENQAQAKASFIYAIKEFRHCGCALAIDIIRYYGLDIEVRTIANYVFLKAHGIQGLPNDLRWIYRYYDLFRDIMQMKAWAFIVLTRKGGIGHGVFQYPYWHKEEHEDILSKLSIEIEVAGIVNYGDKGYRPVSDFEHVDIIRARLSLGEGYRHVSMMKLAKGGVWKYKGENVKLQKRSPATINQQIDSHNKDIKVQNYCQICKRLEAKDVMSKRA